MDRRAFAVSSLLALPALATTVGQDQSAAATQAAHEAWVFATLRQMLTIKPGMTRGDLLKAFARVDGFRDRRTDSFYSRACMFFRVDVEFTSTSSPLGDDRDVISTISRPYLETELRGG